MTDHFNRTIETLQKTFQNVSKLTNSTQLTATPTQLSSWLVVILLLCVVGSVSNVLVITVVLRIRELRTSCGVLIAHLSVTYLMQCAVIVPLTSVRIYNRFDGGPDFCRVVQFVNSAIVVTGYYNEALLAANRLFAICYPYGYRVFARRSLTLASLALCWILGGGTRMPFVFNSGGFYNSLPNGQCTLTTTTNQGTFWAIGCIYFCYGFVGFAAVAICAKSAIGKFHRRTIIPLPATQSSGGKSNGGMAIDERVPVSQSPAGRAYQRRMRQAQMLIMTFIWNCLCNFPITIVNSVAPQLFRLDPMFGLWMRLLLVLSFAFHPILVFMLSTDYRKALKRLCSF
ncbi:hypothetical protein BV898_04991 [Hypsibius exemplaris]|uniref:G-protein coupled receptors family 1 profile domain-containing protein n=1 Tax=Hypsibius exemplaris TaxID=2072580 RepID=A0A1W0X0B4_HYPEX|nr:hypothetical protein BV898_04991 [Hypsibius exemplaris]